MVKRTQAMKKETPLGGGARNTSAYKRQPREGEACPAKVVTYAAMDGSDGSLRLAPSTSKP